MSKGLLTRICDPCFIDDEFEYIRASFRKLGYPESVILRALSDARRKVYLGPRRVERDNTKPSLILPYSNNAQLLNPVKQSNNVHIIHKKCNSIRSQLVRTKPKVANTDPNKACGTYVIPCGECDKVYVGETGRAFDVRLREHKSYIRYADERSAVFRHVRDEGHSMAWNEARVVFPSACKSKRLLVESALIDKLDNFNIMGGVCTIDEAYRDLIFCTNRSILRNYRMFNRNVP